MEAFMTEPGLDNSLVMAKNVARVVFNPVTRKRDGPLPLRLLLRNAYMYNLVIAKLKSTKIDIEA